MTVDAPTETAVGSSESQYCQCDEPEPTEIVYGDPRTSRSHRQTICEKCGDPIRDAKNGEMV